MHIQVTKEKTPEEIQAEFCAAFPHLRLAFFDFAFRPGPAFTVSYGGRMFPRPEADVLSGQTSVGQAEQLLHAALGLSVRVLRRNGNRWQDAGIGEDRTLEEQNNWVEKG